MERERGERRTPTIEPTQRELPDDTLPRLSESGERVQCVPSAPKEKAALGGVAQLYV